MKLRSTRNAIVLTIVAASLIVVTPGAQATKYAGAFMADGGGARALGMGSAFVAVADDASATFWNPAGLLSVKSREVNAMHSERFGDLIDRDFVSYVQPKGQGSFGFSLIRLGIDDIPFTDHLTDRLDANNDGQVDNSEAAALLGLQDEIRFESDSEWAFMGTYARPLGEWQVGATIKFVRQSVGDFSSAGVGVDLGALRRDIWRQLDVGIKLQDITTTYLSWSTGRNETVAPVAVPGAAYDISIESARLDLTFAAAFEIHFDGRKSADQYRWGGGVTSNAYYGIEATLSDRAHIRAGNHGGWDSSNFTYGVGLELGPLLVDYALAGDVLDIDENTHRASLGYRF